MVEFVDCFVTRYIRPLFQGKAETLNSRQQLNFFMMDTHHVNEWTTMSLEEIVETNGGMTDVAFGTNTYCSAELSDYSFYYRWQIQLIFGDIAGY